MRQFRSRFGKIAVKLIVAGSTAAAGGLYSLSTILSPEQKTASAPAVSSSLSPILVEDSVQESTGFKAFESSDGVLVPRSAASIKATAPPLTDFEQPLEIATESSVAEADQGGEMLVTEEASPATLQPVAPEAGAVGQLEAESRPMKPARNKKTAESKDKIEVFYATDRYMCSAKDVHLWITTLAPAVLVVAITLILVAGTIVSNRRILWGLGAIAGCFLSFFVAGNALIKSHTLYRLAAEDGLWFSSRRKVQNGDYPLNLGTSLVSIPPNHRKGEMERPSIFRAEFAEDEKRHIMIQQIDALDPNDYFLRLDERIGADDERSAFIFIHGFNVKFDDALRRTAQLSADLEFPGAPILYSWPSHGQLAWYRSDGDNALWSADHLQKFLVDVRNRTGVKRLHLVAHSMGNRTLVAGLELLGLRYPYQQPMLDQVVMAAPDVDLEDFQTRYADDVERCASRATVYASSTDRALLASLHLNRRQRLGLTMASRASVAGVDFVDVTPIDTSLLGHSYYGSHPLMIQELSALFRSNIGPDHRNWLTQKDAQLAPPVWRFASDIASGLVQQR